MHPSFKTSRGSHKHPFLLQILAGDCSSEEPIDPLDLTDMLCVSVAANLLWKECGGTYKAVPMIR